MTHPYRTSPPEENKQKPTLRHRLVRRLQKLLLLAKGDFSKRNPWPCPKCGLRGFAKLVKRPTCCSYHREAIAVSSDNPGVTFEEVVYHRCCNVSRLPEPATPPGYIPQKWQKCYGTSFMHECVRESSDLRQSWSWSFPYIRHNNMAGSFPYVDHSKNEQTGGEFSKCSKTRLFIR